MKYIIQEADLIMSTSLLYILLYLHGAALLKYLSKY